MARTFGASRRVTWTLALLAGLAVGCGDTSGGDTGGDGDGDQPGDGGNEVDGSTNGRDASLVPPGDGGTLSCQSGMADCDNDAENGCETDLSSLEHCGSCDNACADPANAGVACNNRQCVMTSCDSGFADCDSDDANGCETDLAGKANCGSCGNDCMLGDCMSGSCTAPGCDTANTLKNDCDGDPTNGCETDVNTTTDCGNCRVPCDLAHGTESCTTGTCEVATCDSGYDDCDEEDDNGCEQQLNTTTHCGGCDVPCAFDNAAADCSSGTCTPGACALNFDDCNLDMVTDGCERLLTTLTDCGDCDVPCDFAHATESCSTGTCGFTACEANYVDVNQDSASPTSDGCECNDVVDHANCPAARNLGNLAFGQTVNHNDVIAVLGDEDWYTFTLASGTGNTAGVRQGHSINITLSNNPGGAFKFDVLNTCVSGGTPYGCKTGGPTSAGITTYFFGDACTGGLGGCNTDPLHHAAYIGLPYTTAMPSTFIIKVTRTGAALSCAQYTLQVTRN